MNPGSPPSAAQGSREMPAPPAVLALTYLDLSEVSRGRQRETSDNDREPGRCGGTQVSASACVTARLWKRGRSRVIADDPRRGWMRLVRSTA